MRQFVQRIGSILLTTVVIVVSITSIIVFVGTRLFGREPLVVLSPSMEPAVPMGSLVLVHREPASRVRVGDVITFRRLDGERISHRVVAIEPSAAGPVFRTKGDANATRDVAPVPAGAVVGRVGTVVPKLGRVVHTVTGRATFLAALCLLVLVVAITELAHLRRVWREPTAGHDGAVEVPTPG